MLVSVKHKVLKKKKGAGVLELEKYMEGLGIGAKDVKNMKVNINNSVLMLRPRVKLVYDLMSLRGLAPHPAVMEPRSLASSLQYLFVSQKPPVHVDLKDIHIKYHEPPPAWAWAWGDTHTHTHTNTDTLVAEVTVFFRDLSFINDNDNVNDDVVTKVNRARSLLLAPNKVRYTYSIDGQDHHLVANAAAEPYPLLNNPPTHANANATPIIKIHNLVSAWFAKPNSSQPTRNLLDVFFSLFGKTRYVDFSNDKSNGELCTAFVEYASHGAFLYALSILCCCTLLKEDSCEFVDYEVSLEYVTSGMAFASVYAT